MHDIELHPTQGKSCHKGMIADPVQKKGRVNQAIFVILGIKTTLGVRVASHLNLIAFVKRKCQFSSKELAQTSIFEEKRFAWQQYAWLPSKKSWNKIILLGLRFWELSKTSRTLSRSISSPPWCRKFQSAFHSWVWKVWGCVVSQWRCKIFQDLHEIF